MRYSTGQKKSVQYSAVIGSPRLLGVVGSRSLGYQYADHVGQIVDDVLGRGYHVATGGAIGTDEFALCRLLRTGQADHCKRSTNPILPLPPHRS